jgi:Uncharacterized protein conserved in bacteria
MRYVALLRGINLGNRRLKMDALRAHFEALKFRHVSTFIASGNVLFETAARDAAKLETQIERHLAKTLGYSVDTFLRSADQMSAIAAAKPFPPADMASEINTINVVFLKETPNPADARRLEAIRSDYDAFRVIGREFYWLTRGRMTDSTVWQLPEMKQIRLPNSTMRNLNTAQKLATLLTK